MAIIVLLKLLQCGATYSTNSCILHNYTSTPSYSIAFMTLKMIILCGIVHIIILVTVML